MESFSTASNFTSATLEVKIYCVASAAANEGNVTITAIHQGTPSLNEAYYRFGYRNSSLYLQKFNGAFTTLGTGAALDALPKSAAMSTIRRPLSRRSTTQMR